MSTTTKAMTAGDNQRVGCSMGNMGGGKKDLLRPAGRSRAPKKGKGKAFVPTKGGNGGRAVKMKRPRHWADNAMMVLTGSSIGGSSRDARDERAAFEDALIETTDPCDRAHNRKKLVHPNAVPHLPQSWVLCALGEIDLPGSAPVSRARRYHRSQVVGRAELGEDGETVFDNRVGLDSMFDHAARVAAGFERAGIVLGWGTSFPRERSAPLASERVVMMAAHFAGRSRDQVRNAVQQRTSVEMDAGEIEAQRAGTELLRANRVDWDGMDE